MGPQPRGARSAGPRAVRAGRCFAQTAGVLVLFTVARAFGLLGPPVLAAGLLTAVLAVIAWTAGATLADLGLSRADMLAGLRYGTGALAVVLLVLAVAAAVPATRGFLHDSRAEIGGGRLLYEVGVSIAALTAVPEEFAFRGVLLGSALKLCSPGRAALITSVLFGLWHIAPTLHTMADNRAVSGLSATVGGQVLVVLGAIAVTFLAGLALCWLRLRSRSLIAPVTAHAAANGLALTAAWFALH